MESSFELTISQKIAEGLHTLYGIEITPDSIQLQDTKKEFEGDTTLVVFPFIKASKKSPEATAEEIGHFLEKNCPVVTRFNVVKGFLNLVVAENYWTSFFLDTIKKPELLLEQSGSSNQSGKAPLLMVEYSSPNTNKPLHLGHVRNNLLGYSVAEILKAAGNNVIKVNLVNDRGVHICKSMLAWKKFGNNETPKSAHMKGDHLVGKYYVLYDKKYKEQVAELEHKGKTKEEAEKQAPLHLEIQDMLRKWESGDSETRELWKMMNGWVYEGFEATYEKLGVNFDKFYYESETYLLGKKIVEEGLQKGIFFKKDDGSVWIDLSDVGLDQKLVIRSDGTSVYITQDIGTAQLRFEENPALERLIYVVATEQDYHFKVLKEILLKLGKSWAKGLFHLSYGMVDLPTGKMKSREGTVVDADDLISEIVEEAEMATKALGKLDDFDSQEAKDLYHVIGMGALKYFILKVDPKKKMLFNPAESIDLNGNTGPFIQYTHARIRSVLRKGEALVGDSSKVNIQSLSAEERSHIVHLHKYPSIVREAAEQLSPAIVANYAYDLAKSYNHFYHDHVIVDEAEQELTSFRLHLSKLTAEVIHKVMSLLGIEVPERM